MPKTTLSGDVVGATFGHKTRPHVVLFANKSRVEIVSIYPRRPSPRVTYYLDIRQKLSARDSEALLESLLRALGYAVAGTQRRCPNRFVRWKNPRGSGIHLLVRPGLGDTHIHVRVAKSRAQALAELMADTMGWDLKTA
jgi:hypothetical protein